MDFTLGSNIKKLMGGDSPDVQAKVGSSGKSGLSMPEDPGPAAMGKTPVIGQARRERDLPVVRDRVGTLLD